MEREVRKPRAVKKKLLKPPPRVIINNNNSSNRSNSSSNRSKSNSKEQDNNNDAGIIGDENNDQKKICNDKSSSSSSSSNNNNNNNNMDNINKDKLKTYNKPWVCKIEYILAVVFLVISIAIGIHQYHHHQQQKHQDEQQQYHHQQRKSIGLNERDLYDENISSSASSSFTNNKKNKNKENSGKKQNMSRPKPKKQPTNKKKSKKKSKNKNKNTKNRSNSRKSKSKPDKNNRKKSSLSTVGTKWVLRRTLEGPADDSEFGWRMDMTNDLLVVGMPGRRDNAGSVITYHARTIKTLGDEELDPTEIERKRRMREMKKNDQDSGVVEDDQFINRKEKTEQQQEPKQQKETKQSLIEEPDIDKSAINNLYAGGSVALSRDGFLVVGGYKRASLWKWNRRDEENDEEDEEDEEEDEDEEDEDDTRAANIWIEIPNGAAVFGKRLGPLMVAVGDGCRWVVAAPEEGNSRGQITMFQNDTELMRIVGKAQGDQLGKAITMSRDGLVMAVGAPYHSPYEIENAGQVTIYEWVNIEEEEEIIATPDDEDDDDIDDDFREKPWSVRGRTLNGMGPYDNLGSSVALNGDGTIVATGSPKSDTNGRNSGTVQVFRWDALEQEYLPFGQAITGVQVGEQFGLAVSLSRDGKILAASGTTMEYRVRTQRPGFVRVYRYSKRMKQWKPLGTSLLGRNIKDSFGDDLVLSSSGSRLVVGAGSPGNGYVRVYDLK